MNGVVTISASFGASGNVIGPAVAETLGIPFFDRAISATVAERLSVPIEDVHDEKAPSARNRLARVFTYVLGHNVSDGILDYAAIPTGPQSADERFDDPDRFRLATERILYEIADTTGGVVLGRAGMLVLHDRPDVLRVRLDGPLEERIAHVVRTENMTEKRARAMQRDIDGAREAYVQAFYQAHQSDPARYQVILEATSLGVDVCTAAIVAIARRQLAPWLPSPGAGAAVE